MNPSCDSSASNLELDEKKKRKKKKKEKLTSSHPTRLIN
jgi:hypothetical protein